MSLEDDIRKALTALDGTVPDGYFDELEGRIQQRLEEAAMDVESDMTSDGKNGDPPPPKKKEENTGLHDIKAMAQSAKRRVSRRISTQSEAEEQLLSSSGSMRQVVLPDPTKEIPVDVAPAVDAPASEASERQSRGGIPVWVYAAVAVVAAAAVVFFVVRGKKAEDKKEVARSESPAGVADRNAPEGPAPAAPTPAPTAEPIAPPPPTTNAGAVPEETASAEPINAADMPPAAPAATAPGRGADDKAAARHDRDREERAAGAGGATAAKPKADKPAAPKDPAGPPPPPANPPKKPQGDRSLDELLDDATGGPVPTGGDKDKPKDAPAAPARTDISRDDISTGMSRVLGRVQGCYDKHKESGTVMISVTIDPSGSVSSADATGKFGGTPTGECVAEAVKKAHFPAWDGKAKKINYPFLLSP